MNISCNWKKRKTTVQKINKSSDNSIVEKTNYSKNLEIGCQLIIHTLDQSLNKMSSRLFSITELNHGNKPFVSEQWLTKQCQR